MAELADELAPDQSLDDLYLNLLKKLYKGDISTGDIDLPTTIDTAKKLIQGVYDGYGTSITEVKWNTPDYNKLVHLDKNVYQFSTAKNWQMIRELTSAIKQDDKILPYKEFKNKAITILDEYNNRNLKTEYNAAVAGAQMASKWVNFEQHPEALLEYRTAGDGRVRETHKVLNGITRSVDDHFWKTYYPPNGWNCRCTVIRLNDGKKTADKITNQAMANIAPQKGFTNNLAKEGYVFPKDSAYYIDQPENIRHAHIHVQRDVVRTWAKENLTGKSHSSEIGMVVTTKTNLHASIGKGHDSEFEKNMAHYKLPDLLKEGKKLLPGNFDDQKKRPNIKWNFLTVSIAGKPSYLNIYTDTITGQHYFHCISDKLLKKKPE